MMMNGSSHDWKSTTISMYTRTMENARPETKPGKTCMVRVARECGKSCPWEADARWPSRFACDVAPDAVEIAALHGAINVDYAPDVVMRECFHLIAAGNRCHIG